MNSKNIASSFREYPVTTSVYCVSIIAISIAVIIDEIAKEIFRIIRERYIYNQNINFQYTNSCKENYLAISCYQPKQRGLYD